VPTVSTSELYRRGESVVDRSRGREAGDLGHPLLPELVEVEVSANLGTVVSPRGPQARQLRGGGSMPIIGIRVDEDGNEYE
jgi:hypothetical protein